MIQSAWFNIPVKDLEKSGEFFKAIGFVPGEQGNSPVSASFKIGEKQIVMMLFDEKVFENITQSKNVDTQEGSEMMISIDLESKAEIDTLTKKVIEAGGNVFSKPQFVQGGIYGMAFTDLDGHRWNAIYMDMSTINQ